MAADAKIKANASSGGARAGGERALFDAFAQLKSGKEAARFLRDLATPGELEAFAERWRIARLLDEGRLSYREIAAATGASTTTVGRVARFLREENHQGYRLVLDRMAEKSGAKK
ncbi:YerC/YecD family TrpR-related protein [Hyphococcus sp.]|jgi:TrpR-related protein YerC/YecD|uniref:YerC/YecD family TrpR-related protein n=1 Tax=Hyphococcus sp. TaxID=2038636 RepID=UPI003D0E3317